MKVQPIPQPGQIARVRHRNYLVESIEPPTRPRDATLIRLSCVDDDAQGQPLEVLWETEIGPEIVTEEAWSEVAKRGFDAPPLFAAYLNTLRWNCVTATDPNLFQAPFRAGIRLDAYQLEPLRKALKLPRVNLFIADDVGLGKTIEAGLVARELLLRKKCREILVSCPPSMLLQWKDELEARFGLVFEILDRDYMRRVRQQRGFGVNPFSTHPRLLISHKLLIDDHYTGPMRDWLGTFRPGALLILDEAHHAAPASGRKYAIDSQLTKSVQDLAKRFEHRLFLSATPHNGHSNSFSALLEVLDPQRFCRGVPVDKKARDAVMVRRLKEDLRIAVPGSGFPQRVVEQVDIDGLPADAPELQLAALLDEYRLAREQRLADATKRTRATAGLLICGLQQRLLSSVEAFARTLRVHRKTAERHWEQSSPTATASPARFDLLNRPVSSDDDRADREAEELEAELDAEIEAATAVTSAKGQIAREKQLLEEMTRVAESARHEPDARVRQLIDWIRQNQCPDLPRAEDKPRSSPPPWTDIRVILFTEYDDTKRYLVEQLSTAIAGTDRADERIAVYHGPTPTEKREEIKRAFNADPAQHPVRILVATDAAREGLNLQAHCWNLFHFDVPWNPSRLEQRNGRIDRKLQESDKVYCRYFVYLQRPEDRVLRTIVEKTKRIGAELGSLSAVVESRLERTLRYGIRRDRIEELNSEIDADELNSEQQEAIQTELEQARERQDALREQIDRLRTLLEASRRDLNFDQPPFRAAVSQALTLAHVEPLKPIDDGDDGPPRYAFPDLGGSWADAMDTLRALRKRGESVWEWRRSAPVRPVVFEDPGRVTDEVVQLHLEQRVVQRLLGRFIAQGFVLNDISRACFAQSADAIPRVVLLGRLCLYGPNATRLHEEIVPVTARWIDPAIRKGPLTPYARETETKTLALLEDALAAGKANVPPAALEQLQTSAGQDVVELRPHLDGRCQEYAKDARKLLAKRADDESQQLAELLTRQKQHLEKAIADHDRRGPEQLKLDFGDSEEDKRELRQLEANRRYWEKRLAEVETELATEPTRVREVYDVKATRIEPVGVVYLWPVTG